MANFALGERVEDEREEEGRGEGKAWELVDGPESPPEKSKDLLLILFRGLSILELAAVLQVNKKEKGEEKTAPWTFHCKTLAHFSTTHPAAVKRRTRGGRRP
jgi:hypothetical protein